MEDDTELATLCPAPMPGQLGRHQRKTGTPHGPVGLLLAAVHMAGAVVRDDISITNHVYIVAHLLKHAPPLQSRKVSDP